MGEESGESSESSAFTVMLVSFTMDPLRLWSSSASCLMEAGDSMVNVVEVKSESGDFQIIGRD